MNKSYSVWRMLPTGEKIKAGLLALAVASDKRVTNIRFQYSASYLRAGLCALYPVKTPLTASVINYKTDGALPGFIDDCLPDDWGSRLIAASQKKTFISKSDMLDSLPDSVIGDIMIAEVNGEPGFELGLDLNIIEQLDASGFNANLDRLNTNYDGLGWLLQGGSGVGGARPKLLIDEGNKAYIYKFNRSRDVIDVAANEWASLEVMRQAGLDVCEADVGHLLNRKFLKVKRFDVSDGGRYRLVTMNSMLKTEFQNDMLHSSYDAIASLIKTYSISVKKDLKQLVSQALFNVALNNTDDHLRNFSMINRGSGYQLSPAYDVVPSDTIGGFHQLTMNGRFIPTLERADQLIKNNQTDCFFNLDTKDCLHIVGSIRESMQDFDRFVDLKKTDSENMSMKEN